MKQTLYLMSALILTISSCKKEDVNQNNQLNGTWLLTEIFDGYANGGSFTWMNVSTANSNTITFSANGQYLRQENANGNFQRCTGTFQKQANEILDINTDCTTTQEKYTITELTPTTLILDIQVREGKIRYKYVRQ